MLRRLAAPGASLNLDTRSVLTSCQPQLADEDEENSGGLASGQPSLSVAPARPPDSVGELLVLLGNIQELTAYIGAAHSLGLPPDDLRPAQVLCGNRLKRIEIVSHTP